ncbi:MAG: cytochrome c maturation protein CcmE [Deltaproteobacteria bacterium]|jgi:cytochrome c-type biogenesis protein CcmE
MASLPLKIAASLIVVGGPLYMAADMLQADPESLTYFHGADVVMAKQGEFVGKRIKMGGHVAKGTIFQKGGTLEYQFDVQPVPQMLKHPEQMGKTITVRYTGVVPDTFKDDAEVIVTGSLARDGVFEAQELLAKCPSKYEAAEKNKGTY